MHKLSLIFAVLTLTFTGTAAAQQSEEVRAVVPVVGSTAGAFGANFKTELQVHNPGPQMLTGRLIFRAQGRPGSATDPQLEYVLGPFETKHYADVVAEMGASGLGSMDVVPTNGSGVPTVVFRAFDDKAEAGTTGVTVPMVLVEDALTAGRRAALVGPVDLEQFRFNVGVRTLGEGASIRVRLYNGDGSLAASIGDRSYGVDLFEQRSASDFLGRSIEPNQTIEIEVLSGRVITYATTTDNITNDGSVQIDESFNAAPVVADPAGDGALVVRASTERDQPVTIAVGVIDPDGDPLTYSAGASAANGSVGEFVRTAGGFSVTYTPGDAFTGTDTFEVIAEDDQGGRVVIQLLVEVRSTNAAPVATNSAISTDEDSAVSFVLDVVDPDGDPLTVEITTQPIQGRLTGSGLNWTFSPARNFNGNAGFTFRATDGIEHSNIGFVTITVNPVNDAPEATAQSVSTAEGVPVAITLGGSDVDGDALTFSITTAPANGTLGGTAPNFTYTPNAGFNGNDSFTFTVSDGTVSSVAATVSITVNAPGNNAPVANAQTVLTEQNTAVALVLTGSDPDGDTLTFSVATTPGNGVLSGTAPNLTYTPNTGFTGNDSFTFAVNDGTVTSAAATVSITVNAPGNNAPVANAQTVVTEQNTAVGIVLTGTDADGDTLTYAVATGPTSGTLSGTAPNLTYTPNTGFTGNDSFTFVVNDGTVDSAATTVSITVNAPGNTAPVANAQSVTTEQNTAVGIVLRGTDADGDTLTYAVATGPTSGTLSGTAPNLTYTPTAGFTGNDSFTFVVNDGTVDSAAATVSITVNAPGNTAPVANAQSVTTEQNTAVGFVLAGTDADGDTLTYAVATGPTSGTLSGTAPNLTYTPTVGFSGNDSFTFVVNDGTVDSAAATVSITVNAPGNTAPVANAQSVTTEQNTAVGIVLTGTDADGDTLTYAVATGPTSGTLSGTAPNLTYTPTAGFTGNDSFTFTVNDGTVSSSPATVSITVNAPGNTAPVANAQSVTTDVDTPVVIVLTGSDADGDALTFAVATTPANGVLTGTAPNLTYTPNAAFTGNDSFTFNVNDGAVVSAPATVSITVNAAGNTIPVANDQSVTTDQDTPAAFTLTGSDPDGDAIAFDVTSVPASGTLTGTAPDLTYTPDAGFTGNDSFTFTVNDGTVDSAPATVSITVNAPGNTAPAAHDQGVTTTRDVAVAITLTGSDPEGDAITFDVTSTPASGTLTGTAPALTYTPDAGFTGNDSFTFTVNDGTVASAPATVSITVNAPGNAAPVADSQSVTTTREVGIAITLTGSDPDGDTITFSITSTPANGTLTGTSPALTYTPASGFTGNDSFTFTVNDGTVDSAEATVSITVNAPDNGIPVASGDNYWTDEDVTLNVAAPGVLTNDTDADGDTLTATLVSSTLHGALTLAADGSFTYVPAPDFFGTDSFTYRTSDGTVESSTATVTITVEPVNDAPGFTTGADQTIDSTGGGVRTIAGWASNLSPGPANESGQTLTFVVTGNDNLALFTAGPAISGTTGDLTFTPMADAQGVATITIAVQDNGGTANAGIDTSAAQSFSIQIDAAPRVTSTVPSAGAAAAPSSSITINFNESVEATVASFELQCPAATPIAFTLSASPSSSYTLTPAASLPPGVECQVRVLASEISDVDAFDPPDQLSADHQFTFTVAAGGAATSTISADPSSIVADGTSTSQITVQLKDGDGTDLTTSGGVVTLSTTDGTLSVVTDHNDGTYSATLTSSTTAGGVTVSGTINGSLMVNTAAVSFTAGAAARYLVSSSDSIPVAGSAVTITAKMVDANDNPVETENLTVNWSSTNGGSFGSASSLTDASGVATVTFTTSSAAGTVHAITANDGTNGGTSADITTVVGAAAKYLVSSSDSSPVSGSPVTITAQLADANDNPVATENLTVNWSSTNGGSFGSASSLTDASGVATVTFTTSTTAGTVHAITANDGTTSGTSADITTVVGAAAKYLVSSSDFGPVAGSAVTITAQLVDANDNPLTTENLPVNWSSTNGGSFGSASSLTDATGLATVTFTTSSTAGTVHAVTANDGTFSGTSLDITTTAGAAAKYLVSSSDFNPSAGSSVTMTAQLVDTNDNPVAAGNVTVSWSSTNGGSFGAASSLTDATGLATVSFTTSTTAGTVHAVSANDGTNSGTSADITTVVGAAAKYLVNSSDFSPSAGSSVTITAQLADANDNPVATGNVTVSWSSTNAGSFGSASSLTDATGLATVSFTTSTTAGTVHTVTADDGTSIGTSADITTVAGTAAKYIVSTSDSSPAAGSPVTITAQLADVNDNPVATENVTVNWSSTNGGSFGSASSLTDASGVATVTFTTDTAAGTVHAVTADDGAFSGTSADITTVVGAAAKYLVSSSDFGPEAGSTVTITAQLADANDNPVATENATVNWASTNGGSFGSASSLTDASGLATVSFTTSATAGTVHTVTADDGTSNGTSADITTVVGAAAKYLVTSSDFEPEAGSAVTITAQLADANDNPVAADNVTVNWSSTNGGSFGAASSLTDASGVATVSFTTSTTAGTVHTVAADDTTYSGVSADITTVHGALAAFVVEAAGGGAIGTQQVDVAFAIQIRAVDANGNTVESFDGTVDISSTTATFASGGGTTAAFTSGSLASHSVTISNGGTHQIVATRTGGVETGSSASFAINHPPAAVADSYTLSAGQMNMIDALSGVLANDTDVEGSTLSAILVADASVGTLVLASDGSFSYDLSGLADETVVLDSFTYRVSDGSAQSDVVTVSITISHNAPPVAADDTFTAFEDQELVVAATGVLANDSDPDNNIVRVVLVGGLSPADAGTFTTPVVADDDVLLDDGSFRFTPATDFNGAVTFTYRLEDDGGLQSNVATVTINVTPVNDAPFFTPGSTITVTEDVPGQSIAWASDIRPGTPTSVDESSQSLTFVVTNISNPSLLEAGAMYCPPGATPGDPLTCTVTVQPVTIDGTSGAVIFQPAPDQYGTTSVSVYLQDDGGGTDRYPTAPTVVTFDIVVTPLNDPPSFVKGGDQALPAGTSTAQSVPGWATAISAGPSETGQAVTFEVTDNTNEALFTALPSVASDGTLAYHPTGTTGLATITIRARDDNGTPGDLTDDAFSTTQVFKIVVGNVNDPPTFTEGLDVTVNEDSGAFAQLNWATDIHQGGDDPAQTVTFLVSSDNSLLFSVQPAIGASDAGVNAGRLTFTPDPDRYGLATVTVIAQDNGGTDGGGQNQSAPQTFTITIAPLNDPPVFSASDRYVAESTTTPTAHTVANWVTGLTAGPYESGQNLTRSVTTTAGANLFTSGGQPAVDDALTLTFTTAVGESGTATVQVTYSDDGGTVGDGSDDLSTTQSYSIYVGASPNVAPVVTSKSISAYPNLPISITNAASDNGYRLLDGVTDSGPFPLTAHIMTKSSATAEVIIDDAATGAFTYKPGTMAYTAAGAPIAQSFTYRVCDSGAPSLCSTNATVTVNFVNKLIYFVKEGALAGGSGSWDKPFNEVSKNVFQNRPGPAATVVILSGTYEPPLIPATIGSAELRPKNGDVVVGQGLAGLTLASLGFPDLTVGTLPLVDLATGNVPQINVISGQPGFQNCCTAASFTLRNLKIASDPASTSRALIEIEPNLDTDNYTFDHLELTGGYAFFVQTSGTLTISNSVIDVGRVFFFSPVPVSTVNVVNTDILVQTTGGYMFTGSNGILNVDSNSSITVTRGYLGSGGVSGTWACPITITKSVANGSGTETGSHLESNRSGLTLSGPINVQTGSGYGLSLTSPGAASPLTVNGPISVSTTSGTGLLIGGGTVNLNGSVAVTTTSGTGIDMRPGEMSVGATTIDGQVTVSTDTGLGISVPQTWFVPAGTLVMSNTSNLVTTTNGRGVDIRHVRIGAAGVRLNVDITGGNLLFANTAYAPSGFTGGTIAILSGRLDGNVGQNCIDLVAGDSGTGNVTAATAVTTSNCTRTSPPF